jgi:rfaE bifunctional protein nucleotidyltransferase chain/domain
VTTVFTNGCFDILHPGHISYLESARALGDVLVVALNSDSSVRTLKGEGRPVNPLESRLRMLGALSCVDLVTSFDEQTPESLISRVLPTILVKGGDYTAEQIAGAVQVQESGGRVVVLDFLEGHSTSTLIEKIKASK